jgi:hypothetical protein
MVIMHTGSTGTGKIPVQLCEPAGGLIKATVVVPDILPVTTWIVNNHAPREVTC